jgi:hypothetical protein
MSFLGDEYDHNEARAKEFENNGDYYRFHGAIKPMTSSSNLLIDETSTQKTSKGKTRR